MRDFSWNGYERNRFMVNMGDGSFVEAAAAYGLNSLRDGRGLAVSDFDSDGDLDLVINNYHDKAHYFVNQVARGHWLKVKLTGSESNRDAIGAQVRVRLKDQWLTRVVSAGDGYASQYSKTLHFGLGSLETVPELEVRWPSGQVQKLGPTSADRLLELKELTSRQEPVLDHLKDK